MLFFSPPDDIRLFLVWFFVLLALGFTGLILYCADMDAKAKGDLTEKEKEKSSNRKFWYSLIFFLLGGYDAAEKGDDADGLRKKEKDPLPDEKNEKTVFPEKPDGV